MVATHEQCIYEFHPQGATHSLHLSYILANHPYTTHICCTGIPVLSCYSMVQHKSYDTAVVAAPQQQILMLTTPWVLKSFVRFNH